MSSDDFVALLYLPPTAFPKVRSESARHRRLNGDTAVPIASPVLVDAPSPFWSPRPASSADGNGLGIDWAAEARRALQAYEIRNYQPSVGYSASRKAWEDYGWPHAQHQIGDWFRAANGDWMVWINASCYQLASAGPKSYGVLPRTICPSDLSP